MNKNGMDCPADVPRLYVFVGAYGSGKSEVAVNFARKLRMENKDHKILLADLDIVNPFFRSADAREILEKENIRVISPQYANTNVDVLSVSGEMYSIFDDPSYLGVFDIGGEDMGVRILSSMRSRFDFIPFRMYMVVNVFRPFTADAQGIVKMAQELADTSRLEISGFINNSNLLDNTTEDALITSDSILKEATALSGIPVVFASGLDENLPASWGNVTPSGIALMRMSRTIFYAD